LRRADVLADDVSLTKTAHIQINIYQADVNTSSLLRNSAEYKHLANQLQIKP